MENIAIIYWSGTGNTESMANAIAEGISAAGGTAAVMSVEQCSPDQVNTYSKIAFAKVAEYDAIAFGCPAMGAEVLEESEFEPFFEQVETSLQGKKIALFGSYDWGTGEWMENWCDRVKNNGAQLFETGLTINLTPDADGLASCQEFGKRFSSF